MANLELLDFELQYYLVNKIRFFMEQVDDYYLTLICCSNWYTSSYLGPVF